MIAEKNISNPSHIAKYTYISFGLIMFLWVIAWIFKIQIDTVIHEIELSSFIYWTTAKFLIWILPSLWLIRLSGRTLNQVFNVSNYKTWLLWGLGLGSCIAVAGFAQNYMAGIPIVPTRVDYGRINALLISPIFEEFLVRGALMGNLQKTYPFLKSNLVSSFMFVALHIPGWFFMGNLTSNMVSLNGAIAIFFIGLICGFAANRGNSVIGGMIVHFFNNL